MDTKDWREADRQLRRIAINRAALDAEEIVWLRIARETGVHLRLGYGSLLEYVERVLGYKPKAARERLHMADVLEALPDLSEALATGALKYSAVREIGRVAVPATERVWLEATRGKTVGEIEDMVSGRARGSLPDDPCDGALRPRTLSFEVSQSTFALFRDAQRRLEAELGHPLTDDEVVGEMCRAILGGVRDDGRATHQVAVTICSVCERGSQDAAGVSVPISKSVVDMALCDAQHLGSLDADEPARATQDVAPAVRRQVMRRHHGRCAVPGCRAARYLHLHHIEWRALGGDHSPANLVPICGAHHRAVHDGRLRVRGNANELRFEHDDGRAYGTAETMPHVGHREGHR
jgi:hypothetical protein